MWHTGKALVSLFQEVVMPHHRKTRPKSAATAKSAHRAGAKRKWTAYAYALPESAAKNIVAKRLPAGIKVALFTTSPAAEKRLKAWAPVPIEQTERIVVRELGTDTKPKATIAASAYAP